MPGALAMRGGDRGVSLRAERHQETFKLGLKSFINEARFLAQFDHPSLVKVYRFWEQNRTAYTAMQYYEGRTIKEIVANSPELVDEAWCRKILRQILQALEMLYTMKILHRDISPDNIIVQAERRRGAARFRFGAPDHRRHDQGPDRDPQARLRAGRTVCRRRLARTGRVHRHLRAGGGDVFRDPQAAAPEFDRAHDQGSGDAAAGPGAGRLRRRRSWPPSTRAWPCCRRTGRRPSTNSATCSASFRSDRRRRARRSAPASAALPPRASMRRRCRSSRRPRCRWKRRLPLARQRRRKPAAAARRACRQALAVHRRSPPRCC